MAHESDLRKNPFPLGGMAALSAGPAAVLYDGLDSDGVIREAAFRMKVAVVKQVPAEEFRLAAVFVSLEQIDLEQVLTDLRARDSAVEIWLILGPDPSPLKAESDVKLERIESFVKITMQYARSNISGNSAPRLTRGVQCEQTCSNVAQSSAAKECERVQHTHCRAS